MRVEKPNPGSKVFQPTIGGFLWWKKVANWVEVDPNLQGLRRVWLNKQTSAFPLAEVERLIMLQLNLFRFRNYSVSFGFTRYELYVDGKLDWIKVKTDLDVGYVDVEYALARGMITWAGSPEDLAKVGDEIAEACGATLDPQVRTLTDILPEPEKVDSQYLGLLVDALNRPGDDAHTNAAIARELGRIGGPTALEQLRKSRHSEPEVRTAVAAAIQNLAERGIQ